MGNPKYRIKKLTTGDNETFIAQAKGLKYVLNHDKKKRSFFTGVIWTVVMSIIFSVFHNDYFLLLMSLSGAFVTIRLTLVYGDITESPKKYQDWARQDIYVFEESLIKPPKPKTKTEIINL